MATSPSYLVDSTLCDAGRSLAYVFGKEGEGRNKF
jgi:hypothetical protein